MRCPRCEHENPPQAKFCIECGGSLARACGICGTPLPVGAKFCPECAHPAGMPAAQSRFATPEAYTPRYLAERRALSVRRSRSPAPGSRSRWSYGG